MQREMSDTRSRVIEWERDAHGVVTLTVDDKAQRVNTLNDRFTREFACAVDRLEEEATTIAGVIVWSGKPSFLAGGDLRRLRAVEPSGRRAFLDDLQARKSRTRRLERLGLPVVAIVEGAALGGGLELALACHRRIAVRSTKAVFGLPEATLGLLPGGGGLVRSVRLLGTRTARALVVSGARLGADEAAELGLVDEVADARADAEALARSWIAAHPRPRQPWDDGSDAAGSATGPVADRLQALQISRPDPSFSRSVAIIDHLIRRTATQPVDQSLREESEGLADLVVSEAAKRTIDVVFLDTVAARARARGDSVRQVQVEMVPADTDAAEACARAGLATTPASGGDSASSVRVEVLTVGTSPARTGVRLHRDRVEHGASVAEFWAPEAEAPAIAAWLAKSNVLPLRVTGPGVSFAGLVAAGVDAAAETLKRDGATVEEIRAAKVAAGLVSVRVDAEPDLASRQVLRCGRHLLDAAVQAAAAGARFVEPGALDVAGVRAGGLPSWTGGPTRWRARDSRAAEESLADQAQTDPTRES